MKRTMADGIRWWAPVLAFWLAGCGGTIPDPTPADLQASLAGKELILGDLRETIDAAKVSGFEVQEIVSGDSKGSAATAVVRFRYAGRNGTLAVEGVIPYSRSKDTPFTQSAFEANSIEE